VDTVKNHKETIVLGLGNTLRGDDGIGISMTAELEKKFHTRAEFVCTEEMGLSLLDFLAGYREAVIVDSICTANHEAGTIHRLSLADFPPQANRSSHYAGLPEAAALAKKLDIPFPEKVHILGIEVQNPFDVTTSLSPALQERLPQILKELERILKQILNSECHPG